MNKKEHKKKCKKIASIEKNDEWNFHKCKHSFNKEKQRKKSYINGL